MNDFLEKFKQMSKEEVEQTLKSCSDEEIKIIADAYFRGRDGDEYNPELTYKCYQNVNNIREKLKCVAFDTLIGVINRV